MGSSGLRLSLLGREVGQSLDGGAERRCDLETPRAKKGLRPLTGSYGDEVHTGGIGCCSV